MNFETVDLKAITTDIRKSYPSFEEDLYQHFDQRLDELELFMKRNDLKLPGKHTFDQKERQLRSWYDNKLHEIVRVLKCFGYDSKFFCAEDVQWRLNYFYCQITPSIWHE